MQTIHDETVHEEEAAQPQQPEAAEPQMQAFIACASVLAASPSDWLHTLHEEDAQPQMLPETAEPGMQALYSCLTLPTAFKQELSERRERSNQSFLREFKHKRSLELTVNITAFSIKEGYFLPASGGILGNTINQSNWPEVKSEWLVIGWYPGHYMNDVGVKTFHDGRHKVALFHLWDYILAEFSDFFVEAVTSFLWEVIVHAAIQVVKRRHGCPFSSLAAKLGLKCRQGRHRSVGWAFLTAQVLILLGIDVTVFARVGRCCGRCCENCEYDMDPRSLPGILDICEEVEERIVQRTRQIADHKATRAEIKDVILEEYTEWIDFLWD
jgi:hypothetical protein